MKSEQRLRELIQERKDKIEMNLMFLNDEELSDDEVDQLDSEIDYDSIMLYAFRMILEDPE